MYGLINDAIRRLVCEEHGPDAWERVAARCDSSGTFAAMHYYDDSLTYELVGAASIELEVPAGELLRRFGYYWGARVGPEHYSEILGAAGTDVASVLRNLDSMHARIQTLYTKLRPPSFALTERGPGVLEVHYRSEREGLAQFVVGLLEGLADLYGQEITITQTASRDDGAEHDVFMLVLDA